MKKRFHEEEIRRGIEELRQSGLNLDDVSPALVPRLEEQLGQGRETDLAIVFVLGKIADSGAVETLLRIEKGAEDKNLKKEIRRSLFKLSQKGLTIPEARSGENKPTIPTLARTVGYRSLYVCRRWRGRAPGVDHKTPTGSRTANNPGDDQ